MGVCLFLLCSSQCLHNQPPGYGVKQQLIYKNHPAIRIRISKAKIAKPDVRLIMIESKKSKPDIYVRSYREQFWFV